METLFSMILSGSLLLLVLSLFVIAFVSWLIYRILRAIFSGPSSYPGANAGDGGGWGFDGDSDGGGD